MQNPHIFQNIVSDESEFIRFYPKGYRQGIYKYIFITGGVMSGIGKGIFASSLGYLLQCHGYHVSMMKMEGYLNLDSGTLNPFRHGEVFVLDDGTESDLDLGHYERFLHTNLDEHSFMTAGKIYSIVLANERSGKYLGRDVLVIPHLTGEIKQNWRKKAMSENADLLLVEIGGTVGDYENLHFIEAARQMRLEEGTENVIFCHVSPIIFSKDSQELKTKPTQHSVRTLMELGVQPDFIICRCERPLSKRIKEKVSLYCNIPISHTIEAPDVKSIYALPSHLEKENLTLQIRNRLKLAPVEGHELQYPLETYEKQRTTNETTPITVLIAGKYVDNTDSYISICQALEHAAVAEQVQLQVEYLDVMELQHKNLSEIHTLLQNHTSPQAIIIPGGFGERGAEEKIQILQYARQNQIPCLGICLGFQLALIEIARNLCQLPHANSTEFQPQTPDPIIYLLPSQQSVQNLGGTMRLGKQKVLLAPNSQVQKIYNAPYTWERFRHRYEFNTAYQKKLEEKGVVFSGYCQETKILQIFELPQHPFFIGTQFHPEYLSRPLAPRPLFCALLNAAKKVKNSLAFCKKF